MCFCRPPRRTLSPREVGEATVLAPDHGLQSTRDCAEAARAPPSTRHPNQRQSGRSVAGAAPLPAPFIVISILARDHGIGRVRRGCRPSATRPGGERQAFRRVSGYRISTTLVVGGRLGAPSSFPCFASAHLIRMFVCLLVLDAWMRGFHLRSNYPI